MHSERGRAYCEPRGGDFIPDLAGPMETATRKHSRETRPQERGTRVATPEYSPFEKLDTVESRSSKRKSHGPPVPDALFAIIGRGNVGE